MLNIVVPMAGLGRRFTEAGFSLPKPLIPVSGVPMISAVIDNIRPLQLHRFIFLCLREHLEQHGLGAYLRRRAPGCIIIPVSIVTEGAACTVLLARRDIDTDQSLMIANCDQWVDTDINMYLKEMGSADGLIMTMWSDHPKWSYVRFDVHGQVCEVVEKQVVSNEATVGIYNFRRGADFVWAAEKMITRNLRVNGEFYVAPAYNQMIARGQKIATFNVGRELGGMYGLGIPSDVAAFEQLPVSQKVHLRPDDRQ